jgi:hypothetical protein
MEEEPPKGRRLALKPREIAPSEPASRPGDGTAMSVKLIHQMNRIAESKGPGFLGGAPSSDAGHEVPEGFRRKDILPMDPPAGSGEEPPISVAEMLRRNAATAGRSGGELISLPQRRRSRRWRDFWIILGCAGAALLASGVVFHSTPAVFALCSLAIAFATAVLAWVLFGIMDRY